MKTTILILLFLTALGFAASGQTAVDKARQWNDSLIRPKRPISALENNALNHVILDAVEAASSDPGSVENYLRNLPGFGEGKVLTVQGNAIVWAVGSIGETITYLTTAAGEILATAAGEILTESQP